MELLTLERSEGVGVLAFSVGGLGVSVVLEVVDGWRVMVEEWVC